MPVKDEASDQVALLHAKVKQFLAEGRTGESIIQELAKDGVAPHYAKILIENVQDDKTDKKSFRNSMIMGGVYLGGGILLNFLSYQVSVVTNSYFYYLFWGIIVLGIVTIIRGFILYKK